jgi:hypothetical protein
MCLFLLLTFENVLGQWDEVHRSLVAERDASGDGAGVDWYAGDVGSALRRCQLTTKSKCGGGEILGTWRKRQGQFRRAE